MMQINNLTIKKLEQEITTLSENNLDYLFKLGTFNQIKHELPIKIFYKNTNELFFEYEMKDFSASIIKTALKIIKLIDEVNYKIKREQEIKNLPKSKVSQVQFKCLMSLALSGSII